MSSFLFSSSLSCTVTWNTALSPHPSQLINRATKRTGILRPDVSTPFFFARPAHIAEGKSHSSVASEPRHLYSNALPLRHCFSPSLRRACITQSRKGCCTLFAVSFPAPPHSLSPVTVLARPQPMNAANERPDTTPPPRPTARVPS
jgi:hypothetical protein